MIKLPSVPNKDKSGFLEKFIQKNGAKLKVRYPHFLSLTTLRRFINTKIREIMVSEAVFLSFLKKYQHYCFIPASDNYEMPRRIFVKLNSTFTITCSIHPLQPGRPRAVSGNQITKLIRYYKQRESIRSIADLLCLKKTTVLHYLHKLKN